MAKKRKITKRKKKVTLITKNNRLFKRLKEIILRDSLTGTYNYQYLIDRLDVELKHAKRYIFPLSIIMVDIDYFKSINDTYGHTVGDNVLKEFARYLKKFARTTDVITRYSGAEFVMLLPDTAKDGAIALGERLCEKIQRHTFDQKKNRIKLKVSIGITNFPEDGVDTVSGLIDAADQALQNAKEQGGNRVSAFKALSEEEIKIRRRREGIEDLRKRLKKAGKKVDQALLESIYGFAKAIEARNHYTGEHAEEMVAIVRNIGKELNLSKKYIANLEHAAVLHDLGKIGIDDNILRKRAKLTKREYEQIKKHPRIGAEILRSIHFLRDVVPMILHHHERYDGMGYDSGLKGKKIPLGARILAIADVYQALISDRPYRKAYAKKEALEIIKEGSGTQFDPDVVNALFKILKVKK